MQGRGGALLLLSGLLIIFQYGFNFSTLSWVSVFHCPTDTLGIEFRFSLLPPLPAVFYQFSPGPAPLPPSGREKLNDVNLANIFDH